MDSILRRVAEFDEVIRKTADQEYIVKIREQQADIPVCTLDDLREADGVIFGTPTRYGNMNAQMKQLIDSTASLWLKGEMEGKPAFIDNEPGNSSLFHLHIVERRPILLCIFLGLIGAIALFDAIMRLIGK